MPRLMIACLAALLSAQASLASQAPGQGLYFSDWEWKPSDTKAGQLVDRKIELRMCWDIPSNLNIPGGKTVAEWKNKVEGHILAYWNGYAGIHFRFVNTDCDVKIGHDDRRYHPDGKNWAPHAYAGKAASTTLQTHGVVLCWTYQQYHPGAIMQTVGTQLNYHAGYHEVAILAQATHEFGHVLGLAHEQNRADAPAGCKVVSSNHSYTPIGFYDEKSIMNYCNPDYAFRQSTPSCGDIATVRAMYGHHPYEKNSPECVPECASGLTPDLAKTGETLAACKESMKFIFGSLANYPDRILYPDEPNYGGNGNQNNSDEVIVVPDQRGGVPRLNLIRNLSSITRNWTLTASVANPSEVYAGSAWLRAIYMAPNPDLNPEKIPVQRPWAGHPGDKQTPYTITFASKYGSHPSLNGYSWKVLPAQQGQPKKVQVYDYDHAQLDFIYYRCQGLACQDWWFSDVFLNHPLPQSFFYFNALDSKTKVWKKPAKVIPAKTVNGVRQLNPFVMDVNEVTQKDYMAIMREFPFSWPGDVSMPAETVTWFDAILYCNKRSALEKLKPVYTYASATYDAAGNCNGLSGLVANTNASGYRLPTLEEWLHAFKAGTTTELYWGSRGTPLAAEHGWYVQNSGDRPHPVGKKSPNPWGLHDMWGNVAEWVWTINAGTGMATHCAMGGYYLGAEIDHNNQPWATSQSVSCGDPATKWRFIGFRPVKKYIPLEPSLLLLN